MAGRAHVSVQFADAVGLDAAARTLGGVPRDHDTLTLQIPSDGSVASLKALLNRLDDQSIAVKKLSIHTSDLDDVFFALTGNPTIDASAGADKHKVTAP